MNARDPKLIVLLFNERKRERDVEGMAQFMAHNHSLICYGNVDTTDRESSIDAWTSFFKDYPDYQNHYTKIESRDGMVFIVGFSTCSYKPLDGPALWTAKVEDDLIAEWRVYDDTEEDRRSLGLQVERQ